MSRHIFQLAVLNSIAITWASVSVCDAADDREAFFENRIRPILVDYCYDCHSAETDSVMGGLNLDHRAGWQVGGDSGPSIVPEDAENSLLFQAVDPSDKELQMPPDDPLDKGQIADLRRWIEEGAFDPRTSTPDNQPPAFDLESRRKSHWAWQPPAATKLSAGFIDDRIEERLAQAELIPTRVAPPHILLRRLYLDLIGMPPAPADVQRFSTAAFEDSVTAVEAEVDRLLADPRFGEHWARHWLDVVRYGDTKGHVTDQERPYSWKYRDYVIRAFNDDLPYDQFVIEHLAGDLLPSDLHRPGPDGSTNVAPTATGFLFMHEMHFMAVDPIKQRWDEINAQIDVVGKAFLGLTIECARCHDHKFDAISQRDYYALAGFFYNTELVASRTGPRDPQLAADAAKADQAYQSFLEKKRAGRRKAQAPKANGEYFPVSDELGVQSPNDSKQLFKLMRDLESADPSWKLWARSATDSGSQDVALRIRGEHQNRGEVIPRGILTALASHEESFDASTQSGSGRYWLARQLVSQDNPLTARVWVNRLWHHLMGQGIVATPNNFGALGDAPSHPELLDDLAEYLLRHGWSSKAVIREIVLSRAYQRSDLHPSQSSLTPEQIAKIQLDDPNNRLLAYRSPKRLTGEQLRDSLLAISGTLDDTSFGPGVDLFIPPYATANKKSNVPASGPLDGKHRRSIYLKVRRNFSDPLLAAFDFPDRGKSIGRRTVTQTSRQALALMNSPFVHLICDEWSEELAKTGPPDESRLIAVWTDTFGQNPSPQDLEVLSRLDKSLDAAEPRARWKSIVHVLINHPRFLITP